MISLGNQYGGPELKGSAIRLLLQKIMQLVSDLRDENYDDGTSPWVNIIFIVPGSLIKPDFSGMKTGFFSKKRKGLVIQIAVPQSVLDCGTEEPFAIESLMNAMDLADEYFRKKGLDFDLGGAKNLILEVRNLISN